MTDPGAEPYRVVARRFRPTTFDEVVGQEPVVRSLRTALESGRVPHAFLFAGSRGVGKTTSARVLARALNCERGVGPDPCGECSACKSILGGTNADVVEIDAASHNLVDDIRALRDRVGFASMGARYKVYILDEVHMLTRSAFNAFLKTLEEPPPNVVFVLATTEVHKVPETIRSRCQVLLFGRVGEDDIVERLRGICGREDATIADDVLADVAAACRGGMRDAETALERILPMARDLAGSFDLDAYRSLFQRLGPDRVLEVVDALIRGEAREALGFADAVVAAGADEREALGEVLETLRAVMLLVVDGVDSTLVPARGALRERLVRLAEGTPIERLDAMIQAGLVGRERIRRLDDRRLVLEVTLIRIAQAGSLPVLGDVVAALEAGVASGVDAGPRAAAPAVPGGLGAAPGGDLRAALAARLREVKPMLVSTIESCSLTGPDDAGLVVLTLETTRKMHRDRLASTPVRDQLRTLIGEVLGRDDLQLEVADRAAAEGGPAPHARPAAGREPGPAVRRVVDRFDGRIVD